MTLPPTPPPLPAWAPPGSTWDQLVAMMRFWLKPGDKMFTDEQLVVIMLGAKSFPRAVLTATHFKLRMYNDPNRLKSATIGSESMTWGEPLTMERERELLNAIKADLGLRSNSRILALDEYPQVYGVTPYRTSPYPEVLPATWPEGTFVGNPSGQDRPGLTQQAAPASSPAASPTPDESPPPPVRAGRQPRVDPPRRTVRTRPSKPRQ